MRKLTLEHLAPYLPYGLKVKLSDEGRFNLVSEYPNEHQHKEGIITHFTTADDGIYGEFKVSDRYYFSFNDLTEITLCLRPLSDLTKEIEHKGHTIIPIDYISTSTQDGQRTMRRVANEQEMDVLNYWKIQRLFEMHFDVFGLIPSGLAIDINTLKGDSNV